MLGVVYETPRTSEEARVKELIQSSGLATNLVDMINGKFRLVKNITIVIGARDGPLYDDVTTQVRIPYGFMEETKARFRSLDSYAEIAQNLEDATLDVFMYMLLHQVGHALAATYGLIALGVDEDAIDSLAITLLIENYENGQDIALSAVDIFFLENQPAADSSKEDIWAQHGFDTQRFYRTICFVYGSDPDRYASLIQDSQFLSTKGELCKVEYARQVAAWNRVLQPYTKL